MRYSRLFTVVAGGSVRLILDMFCWLLRLRSEFQGLSEPERKFEFLDELGPNMRGELTF